MSGVGFGVFGAGLVEGQFRVGFGKNMFLVQPT